VTYEHNILIPLQVNYLQVLPAEQLFPVGEIVSLGRMGGRPRFARHEYRGPLQANSPQLHSSLSHPTA
jgi:hypothetical protein